MKNYIFKLQKELFSKFWFQILKAHWESGVFWIIWMINSAYKCKKNFKFFPPKGGYSHASLPWVSYCRCIPFSQWNSLLSFYTICNISSFFFFQEFFSPYFPYPLFPFFTSVLFYFVRFIDSTHIFFSNEWSP